MKFSVFGLSASFFEKYFSFENAEYENLGIGAGSIPITQIILAMVIGMILAFVAMTVYKKTDCAFVQRMIKKGAVGRENAMSFDELDWNTYEIVRSLRGSSRLRRVVKSLGEVEHSEKMTKLREEHEKRRESEPDIGEFVPETYKISTTDRFYIPEDMKDYAAVHFETHNTTWLQLIIIVVCCIVGYFVLVGAVPKLLELLDSTIGSMKY